ncbi:hypothetical protein D3C78_97690 [compost metagenome]
MMMAFQVASSTPSCAAYTSKSTRSDSNSPRNHEPNCPENVHSPAHSGFLRAVDPPRHLGAFCLGITLNFRDKKLPPTPYIGWAWHRKNRVKGSSAKIPTNLQNPALERKQLITRKGRNRDTLRRKSIF